MTETLWTAVAFLYCLAAVYLQAFDRAHHPTWVWAPFLTIGGAIFLLINGNLIWGPDTTTEQLIEYLAISAILLAGAAMFYLSLRYARIRDEYEQLRRERRKRRQTTLDDHD